MFSSASRACSLIFLAAMTIVARTSEATENGGSSYPMGADSYLTAVLPPPGMYGQVFGSHYTADELKDNSGRNLPIDFHLRVNVIAPRLIWVSEQQFLGGQFAIHAIAPLVDINASVNGLSQHNKGLGDVIFGPALGYHFSDKFHAVLGLDTIAPSGEYDRHDVANLGRNYWVLEPLAAFSYTQPEGINADIKAIYSYNFENPSTHYRSGQEFHFDYTVGWGVGSGWVLGVGGYFYRQTTDDRDDDGDVPNNKGRAFAIGPAIKYSSNSGWFLTAKWQKEQDVRNRPEGDAYWLKLSFPL
jgi:hypothetical protein